MTIHFLGWASFKAYPNPSVSSLKKNKLSATVNQTATPASKSVQPQFGYGSMDHHESTYWDTARFENNLNNPHAYHEFSSADDAYAYDNTVPDDPNIKRNFYYNPDGSVEVTYNPI